MQTLAVKSFAEFHDVIRRFLNNRKVLFRGHNNVNWDLLPKAGRKEYQNLKFSDSFPAFKRRAVEFLDVLPENEWDWLAIAQHHGLPTPLLDWSYNPLVAAYFAAFPFEDRDCAIYAFYDESVIDSNSTTPAQFKGVGRLIPRGIAQRIVRQGGIFTYHNPVTATITKPHKAGHTLLKIIVQKSYRREFVFELDKYGINRMTLFPDLDGLCSYQSWASRDDVRDFWTNFGTRYDAKDVTS